MHKKNFKILSVLGLSVLLCGAVRAQNSQNLTTIGVTLLRAVTTNLDGSGIRVAQPEGSVATGAWEVDPANVGLPASRFSYFSSAGSATTYPNALGTNSWHAEWVGTNFYDPAWGVATNVAHVDNYEADYFYNSVINAFIPANINDPVVNQSFIFTGTVSQQQQFDSAYDDYAAQFETLFISGAGNGGPVNAPATCYNGIGVGVWDGTSSYGPTLDNGRCKPDLTAPGYGVTSFSTAYVSGAATVLLQAALRGDGGGDTTSAADMRTLKAVLLNGAVKPVGWTNATFSPLDLRYGAGMLNAFNAYEQLAGGKHTYIAATTVSVGGAHPPTSAAGTVGALIGWDFNTNTSGKIPSQFNAVNHYYFTLSNSLDGAKFTAAATLVWNRQQGRTSINNLNLFLYNCANSNLIICSTSLVDNVEHLWLTNLAQGRYDLQVWKAGGNSIVSAAEPYALAWVFVAPTLGLSRTGANATLIWPAYPAGYQVQATTNLLSAWSANNLPAASVMNSTNTLSVPMMNGVQFFRLRAPNF